MRTPASRIAWRIERALRADQAGLRRRLRQLERALRSGRPASSTLDRLSEDVERSIERRARRRRDLPRPRFPEELPISARRGEIAAAIRAHPVVIVCGPTGSGKSTQLPKICLELGLGANGLIGHTQPRRIAARTIAARLAAELGSTPGHHVGFKVRFGDTVGERTYVKVMTDGILLAELAHDRFLDSYDAIILDEAHERSLNIDFLLGHLKHLGPRRPDLKVVIASATLDARRLAEHFAGPAGPAPIVEVSGRTYPIEVRYRPPAALAEDAEMDTIRRGVLDAVDEIASIDRGDILIFMPTERDINATARALRGHRIPGDDAGHRSRILPLYARLSTAAQNLAFQPQAQRRIVIATNVAESAVTVPGIHYVIDEGTARISRYTARSKLQRLPIEPISQASAEQRKGRCGRVAPGVCIRLYAEEDLAQRDPYTQPEILRTSLASAILRLAALDLGRIEDFPFLDPPRPAMVRDGLETLREIGALDGQDRLTRIGSRLAGLPVDPRIGRMILAAHEEDCLGEVLIIASALECEDPRLRPPDQADHADQAHQRFRHPDSDFLAILNLWDFCHALKLSCSRRGLRVACEQNYLAHQRLGEWSDLHRQLLELVGEAGLAVRPRRDDAEAIHRALLTGLLANIAVKTDRHEYTGAGGKKLRIWPGSSQFERRPQWIVAAEQVETTQRYARTVARVQPAMIEPLAAHLVTRTYAEPQWDRRSAHVVAFEKVSLFGLPLVPRRRVHYGRVDPAKARAMFIHHALVLGELDMAARFLAHNRALVAEIESLEARIRRRDLLADEQVRFDFFDRQLPPLVCDGPSLARWLRDAQRRQPRVLMLSRADLLAREPGPDLAALYPDRIRCGDLELPLTYRLEPGSAEDGVTVTVPLACLPRLEVAALGWLVPGLAKEKVLALIRTLPKSLRQRFVPAASFAGAVLAEPPDPFPGAGAGAGAGAGLEEAVAARLGALGGVAVPASAFEPEKLAPHLHLRVRVVDAAGRTLAAGRDLASLREQCRTRFPDHLAGVVDRSPDRPPMARWECGALEPFVEVQPAGVAMRLYPALVDHAGGVGLTMCDWPEEAAAVHRGGVRRLLVLELGKTIRSHLAQVAGFERLAMLHAAVGPGGDLRRALVDLVADRAMGPDVAAVRDPAAFEVLLNAAWNRIGPAADESCARVGAVLEAAQRLQLVLAEMRSPAWREAVDQVRAQLGRLLGPDFLVTTPWAWLQQFPRFLGAAERRLRKLAQGALQRDQAAAREVEALERARHELWQRGASQPRHRAALESLGWLLEEYRVSLFAQELGTSMPVSAKRLAAELARCRALLGVRDTA